MRFCDIQNGMYRCHVEGIACHQRATKNSYFWVPEAEGKGSMTPEVLALASPAVQEQYQSHIRYRHGYTAARMKAEGWKKRKIPMYRNAEEYNRCVRRC